MTWNIVSTCLAMASQTPRMEVCGFIVSTKRGVVAVPARNISKDPAHRTEIDPKDYASAEDMGDVIAVFHSHPSGDPTPSDVDRRVSDILKMPMLIVSSVDSKYQWVRPAGDDFPLLGRPYVYGIFDCWELARDYYRMNLSIDLPKIESEQGWAESGRDLFMENLERTSFVEVPPAMIRVHDLVLIQTETSRVPNHVAIYVSDSEILHHLFAGTCLSSKGLYGNHWRKRTRHVVRHMSLMKEGDHAYVNGETKKWSP